MEFDFFTFVSMIELLGFIGIGTFMVRLFIKQMKDRNSEAALPFLVVQATLVEKRGTRGNGKTRHYATFEFENGDRHEFRVPFDEYHSLVEGYVGQLSVQGTSYKKFEKIG